jgi:hypothetical protein
MIRFVPPRRLARAARPGYVPGGKPVDKALVDAWIADAGMAIEHPRAHVESSRRSASFGTHRGTGRMTTLLRHR